jgi:O-antigen/teichoic acid export membrane protein
LIGAGALTGLIVQTAGATTRAALLPAVLAVYLSLEAASFATAAASGIMAYRSLLTWRAVGRVTALFLAVVVLVAGRLDALMALAALAVGNFVTATGTLRTVWSKSDLGTGPNIQPRSLARFGVHTWVSSLLTIALGTQKDVLLLTVLAAGPGAIGQYSVAATLTTQLTLMLSGGWVPASLPLMTSTANAGGRIADTWRELAIIWAWIVAPIFTLLALASPVVTPLLFGAAFQPAVASVAILAGGFAITAVLGGPVNQLALYAADQTSLVVVSRTTAVVVNFALALTLIPVWGASGAACATAAAVLTVFAIELRFVKTVLRVQLPWREWSSVAIPTLAGTAAAVSMGLWTENWLAASVLFAAVFLVLAWRSLPTNPSALWSSAVRAARR